MEGADGRSVADGRLLPPEVVAGVEQLTQGWRLTWAIGPFGGRTGPTAEAESGQATLVLDLGR